MLQRPRMIWASGRKKNAGGCLARRHRLVDGGTCALRPDASVNDHFRRVTTAFGRRVAVDRRPDTVAVRRADPRRRVIVPALWTGKLLQNLTKKENVVMLYET